MENNAVETNKNKNLIIGVMACVIVLLIAALVYFLFIKKDKTDEQVKPQDNQQTENNNELQNDLEKINEEVFKLLHEETSVEEFKKQAEKYFTKDMISELIKYYSKDTKTICLESSVCYASGGFFGETTDIMYRSFEIVSVQNDMILAKGIYGESSDNTNESKIEYKKENSTWKIAKFDIIDFSNEGVYKTVDGKFTFKIAAHTKEAYLNNEKFNYTDVEYDERYAFYSGYFEGEVRQDDYHFLIDKEKGIIVEKDFENVSKLNDKVLRFYGESDLSKFNTFFKCSAGYFFISYLGGPFDEGDVKIVNIYTTDWKELGYIDLNNVKADKTGIFVYEKYDENYKLSGKTIKYDIKGNKIN